MFKFKKGDEIQVRAGRDKGKKGKIEKVFPREDKIVVGGVNTYKRHRKATRTQRAGIFEVLRPISVANVSLICPKCGKLTRVGFSNQDNSKVRICKKCKGRI